MREYLYFNKKSSADFALYITDAGVYATPRRSFEKVSVPGRNGDLLIENNKYENVDMIYPAVIVDNFDTNYMAFVDYMLSQKGYQRLEDSFHPDEFYLATFKNIDSHKHALYNQGGTFKVVFERKPQRFLKNGDNPIEFNEDGAVVNFTNFDARPLIRVYGTGTFGVGEDTITITQADEYTDIDCDLMDAYKGQINCNSNIILNSGKFPTLPSGESGISLDGVSKVIIYPRWYTL